jgi:hypothetical protein
MRRSLHKLQRGEGEREENDREMENGRESIQERVDVSAKDAVRVQNILTLSLSLSLTWVMFELHPGASGNGL